MPGDQERDALGTDVLVRQHLPGLLVDAGEHPAEQVGRVAGSALRAEELYRPLAYYLKQQVEGQLAQRQADGRDETPARVLVVADFRYMNDKPLHGLATISVGGPGVNALAHAWFEELPFSFAVDEQFCIQMDPDLVEPRVSIWGMDNASTQVAASMFVDRYLGRFLDRAAQLPVGIESEDEDESDDETEEDDDEE